jgi:hypothetical protein
MYDKGSLNTPSRGYVSNGDDTTFSQFGSANENVSDEELNAVYDELKELDVDLPMTFGSEATLVSAEALTIINERIKFERKCDIQMAAMVVQRDDHILEATSRGLMLGHMGPLAHALYSIEALLKMNDRAKGVIAHEYRKIEVNNQSIAMIQKLVEEAHTNTAIYDKLRHEFNDSSQKLTSMRNTYHVQQQGPSYIQPDYRSTSGSANVNLQRVYKPATSPYRRRIGADLTGGRPHTSLYPRGSTSTSVASIPSTSKKTASLGDRLLQTSPTPEAGVKYLFGPSKKTATFEEDDEEQILEALEG